MARSKKIYTDVLFCDNVRSEVGNKISMMGIYAQELVLQEFPAIMPTFGFFVTVATDDLTLFDGMEIAVSTDGVEEIIPISPATIEKAKAAILQSKKSSKEKPEFLQYRFSANLMISPLKIAGEGNIVVSVKTVAGEFMAGSLAVKKEKKRSRANPPSSSVPLT
jgi:hypothetical protein